MRLVIVLGALALALGCTTQSAGQRCEQNQDCNGEAGEECRRASNPTQPCEGLECLCCPTNVATAAGIPGCTPGSVQTDAGRRD